MDVFITSQFDETYLTASIDLLLSLTSYKVLPRVSVAILYDMVHSSQIIGRHWHSTSGETKTFLLLRILR